MNDLLSRGVAEIIDQAELARLLKGKTKLRLKLGVDPSSPDIHLGHAVVLRKLRAFQEAGHTVIFLIGDATARIGDPSGRNKTRPVLNEADIAANAQTYLDQVGKIIDLKQAEVRRNSEWLDQLNFSKLLQLAANFTVAQLVERDDFAQRLKGGSELGLHELLYPVMQAYDSVMLKADVEFGGSDQRFNMLAGRALQKKMGQPPQQIVMTKLILGTDGQRKMSKSLGNHIGISEAPGEMYGRLMSIPDQLIAEYYQLATDIEPAAIDELVKTLAAGANPRDAKASLAREIVRLYHGEPASVAAEQSFNKLFRDRETPTDIEEVVIKGNPDNLDLLVEAGLAASRSEARRAIKQGGLKLQGQTITDIDVIKFEDGDTIQAGKRRFVKIRRQ